MRTRSSLWSYLVIVLTVSSCATTTPYNPFKVPQSDIRSRVKVVALAPINLPLKIDDPEPVKTKFESLVTAKLLEGGFRIVPSSEYGAVWKQMTEKLGGFFNPITGKRDEEKFKAVREHTLREVAAKSKADALLEVGIVPVGVNFTSNRAAWHGTTENLVPGGAFTAYVLGGHNGTTTALSLGVALSDFHGVEMYDNAGGIQLLTKISAGQFVSVPRQELFADEERNRQAVNIALDPLIGKADAPKPGAGPPSEHGN